MPRISFDFEWLDPSGVPSPELAATWASFRIRVGETCLTRVYDRSAQTVRKNVYVPLYPVAEWLAANWWFLRYELKNKSRASDSAYRSRHALIASREGYAYPDLEIAPMGPVTHLLWKTTGDEWSNVEYLDGGEDWVDAETFGEDCADFINRVTCRLESLGIQNTYLQHEWAAVQSADEEEARYCRTAAGLGWDPYALEEEKHSWLVALSSHADELLTEAMAVLDPSAPQGGWLAIQYALDALGAVKSEQGCAFDRIRGLRSAARAPENARGVAPWKVGYEWARQLRIGLGDEEAPVPGMADLADFVGEKRSVLDDVSSPVSHVDAIPMVDGVVTRSNDGVPVLGLRRLGEPGRRFHLCRAIAEILTGGAADSLVTQAESPRQKRNRAFAAEFLVPSRALRRRVKSPVVGEEEVERLAEKFGVSTRVVEHQLHNHDIAQVEGPGLHPSDATGRADLARR